jgi:hypothetical protein
VKLERASEHDGTTSDLLNVLRVLAVHEGLREEILNTYAPREEKI